MSERKNNDLYYFYGTLVLGAFLISLGGLLYRSGYRLNSFGLVQAGSIELAVYESGSKIYIDNILQKTTFADQEIITFNNLSPDTHRITILKDGFEVWQKNLEVKSKQTKKVSAFLKPQNFILEKITDAGKMKEILFLFEKIEAQEKIKQRNGEAFIWREGKSLFAEWTGSEETIPEYLCENVLLCIRKPVVIFEAEETIENIDFYKERDDVLLFSSGSDIKILELDGPKGKTLHTLYSGNNPIFLESEEKILYIKDNQDIVEITL